METISENQWNVIILYQYQLTSATLFSYEAKACKRLARASLAVRAPCDSQTSLMMTRIDPKMTGDTRRVCSSIHAWPSEHSTFSTQHSLRNKHPSPILMVRTLALSAPSNPSRPDSNTQKISICRLNLLCRAIHLLSIRDQTQFVGLPLSTC